MLARFSISQSQPLYLNNFQKIIKRTIPSLRLSIIDQDKVEVLCEATSEKTTDFILLGIAINTYENEINAN